jgi:hypothetical protein
MVGEDDGSSGSPPSIDHLRRNYPDTRNADEILREMAEALELPGYASSYVQVIESGLDPLWKRRLVEPQTLREVEHLGLLVLDVVRRYPEVIARDEDYEDDEQPPGLRHLSTCDTLYRLYVDQGYLQEAEAVIRRGIDEFGQARFERGSAWQTIHARRELLEAEDA